MERNIIEEPQLSHLLELLSELGNSADYFILVGARAMSFMVDKARSTKDFDFVLDAIALRGMVPSIAEVLERLQYDVDPKARNFQFFKQIAEVVRSNQGKIAIDLEASSPVKGEALHKVLALADMVFCSQGGLGLIANGSNMQSGIDCLFDLGVQTVIVTQGSQGAAAHTPDAVFSTPAYNNIPVVDTTGAGDCFHAAYIAAILDDATMSDAIHFAAAAAALTIQHVGARNGLPERTAVNHFMAHHNMKPSPRVK